MKTKIQTSCDYLEIELALSCSLMNGKNIDNTQINSKKAAFVHLV